MELEYKEHTIKKNDYVRTINGQLDRIKRIQQGEDYNGSFLEIEHYSGIVDLYRCPMISIYPVKYKNNSKDIIDLIEVGDYVNRERVTFITNSKIKEKKIITEYDTDFFEKYEKIETIVTKEQFESIEYKMGE